MKDLAGGLLVASVFCAPSLAQERDHSLERISVALERPLPIVRGVDQAGVVSPKSLDILTLVPPTLPGEMVRVSVPIGDLFSRALHRVAAAKHRRQEAAARRRVAAALQWFEEQSPSGKR